MTKSLKTYIDNRHNNLQDEIASTERQTIAKEIICLALVLTFFAILIIATDIYAMSHYQEIINQQ